MGVKMFSLIVIQPQDFRSSVPQKNRLSSSYTPLLFNKASHKLSAGNIFYASLIKVFSNEKFRASFITLGFQAIYLSAD